MSFSQQSSVPELLRFNNGREKNTSKPKIQFIDISPSTTRSIRGWKSGMQAGLGIGSKLILGGFHYIAVGNGIENRKKAFSGIYASGYINQGKVLKFGTTLRLGRFNQKFVSFIPTLDTQVWVSEEFGLSTALGFSEHLPYWEFKISARLTTKF